MKAFILGAVTALALPLAAMANPVYFVAQIQVDDWDKFIGEYGMSTLPTLMQADAKILVGGPGAEIVEGDWSGNHTVVLEFASREAFEGWYNSPEYEALRPVRYQHTSMNNIVVADAFVMPEE